MVKEPTPVPSTLTVAPLTADEIEQVNRVIQGCVALEENLAGSGRLLSSGAVASARQTIRFLAWRLVAPEPEDKATP